MGTGKFGSGDAMRAAIEASGTQIVTVALRRVDLDATGGPDILAFIDPDRVQLLPNTSGAADATEAVRLARLARAMGLPVWVKLEVTPDPRYLIPDPVETLKAAEQLVADGFTVLPYINADPVLAKRLEEAGCATVMPLGSWIILSHRVRSSPAKPSSWKSRISTSGVKIRMTTFSPNAVGMVEMRNSISCPLGETVLIRPS